MADKGKKGKEGKKGGKLPIILVAVLVIAGGGFFAMGGKKEKPKEPEIELGLVESLGEEFLISLGDGKSFLTCEIAVQVSKKGEEVGHVADPAGEGGGHGSGDASYSIARNAVIDVLSSKSIEDISKPDALKHLRREIAAAINHSVHHEEEEPAEEESSSKKKKKKKDEEASHGAHGDGPYWHIDDETNEWLDELGWDAEEGPVLKVFFTSFAYQKY
ncbi:MAG: flagellar basal body-associated FliL family protein [Armatimonadetes bacterium]|nr:flagellar basal body-associated FliL family protein [Armatimonadota bacterium]